jgi:PKHD-type hydroxylase
MNTAKIIEMPTSPTPVPNAAWGFYNDHVESWAYFNGVFTKKECETIIELGNKKLTKGVVVSGDPAIRDSQVAWLFASEGMEWAYRRLTDIVLDLNNQFFKFDLSGFAEGLQFTRYDAPGGKYDMHIDKLHKGLIRKLSLTVQLSNPADYEGGDLMIQTGHSPDPMTKEQGRLIAFPSYTLHGVQPVTKGTRYSLVAWTTGPAFK